MLNIVDHIGNLKNAINANKSKIMSVVNQSGIPTVKHPTVDKVLGYARNLTNKSNGINLTDVCKSIRKNRGKLHEAEKDPKKIAPHLANKLINKIKNSSNSELKDELQDKKFNSSKAFHDIKNDGTLIPNNQTAYKMASEVIKWMGYKKKNEEHSKLIRTTAKKGYVPFKFLHKTYYVPSNMKGSSYALQLADTYNYYESLARAHEKISGALYGKLWHKTVNIDRNELPQMQSFQKADGNYAYRIQKYRIWQNYAKDRYNSRKDYVRGLDPSATLKEINYYRYRTTSKRWKPLLKYYKRDAKKADNEKKWMRFDLKRQAYWKNKADKLVKNFRSFAQRQELAEHHDATIANIKNDTRYTHFGYIRPVNPGTENSYIYFMVTDESPTHETNVTSNPVEWGLNITTGTQMQATQVEIEGYIFNKTVNQPNTNSNPNGTGLPEETPGDSPQGEPYNGAEHRWYWQVRDQANTIGHWADAGAEMFYSGQDYYPHCVISEFNPDYSNSGDDGSMTTLSFDMTLTLCSYFKSNESGGSKHSKNAGGKGRKRGKKHLKRGHDHGNGRRGFVTAKSGTNYISIAREKHVPVSRIEKLNKYSSTGIPIGAKIKY